MPFDWIAQEEGSDNRNQVEFAACFIHPYDNFENVRVSTKPCAPKLLLSGLEIGAAQRNLFLSAEAFDKMDDDGVNALAAYLSIFDEVKVALFYRRYFEWLPSLDNEVRKNRMLDNDQQWEGSIISFIEEGYANKEIDSKHTYSVFDKTEKHFDHIELVNMHNGKDNNEELYCEVMPNADRTCEALRTAEFDSTDTNVHKVLIYEDLAYNAFKQGLIDIENNQQLEAVSGAVQEYQEVTLGLTKYDFPLICLSPEVKDWLLDVSLTIEETLLPEFLKLHRARKS